MVPFQTFPTKDGIIVVACPKQSLWQQLCVALEREELASDERFCDFSARQRNRNDLTEILEHTLASRPTSEWLERLEAHGVPCGAVNDVHQALADRQSTDRDVIAEYDHPTLGAVRTVRTPLRLSGHDAPLRRSPYLGEHGNSVLTEICGYTLEEIDELRSSGAVLVPESGTEHG